MAIRLAYKKQGNEARDLLFCFEDTETGQQETVEYHNVRRHISDEEAQLKLKGVT